MSPRIREVPVSIQDVEGDGLSARYMSARTLDLYESSGIPISAAIEQRQMAEVEAREGDSR